MTKVNSIIKWWVTPKLPPEDVFAKHNFFTQWIIHPVKRRIAKKYLQVLQKYTDIKVIGITGSAGKTTTKEMLASILKLDGKCIYTPKNVDSIYSIPNTILRTAPGTKYLILEMGVEYPGEMDFYLWLAKPDMGIITNIFPTHIEFMQSMEGVFKEKTKLVLSLSKEGTAVLNSGDKKLKSLSGKLDADIHWFKTDINPIRQNENAAKEAAKVFDVSDENIEEGLREYIKPHHRLELIKHKSGSVILDDSYNSNPWAAITTLAYFNSIAKGRKVAVLGDMLELGSYDEQGHRELGREVAKSKFDIVIGVGKSSAFLIDEVIKSSRSKAILVSNFKEALPLVTKILKQKAFVLVKGSHSIGLDKLVDSLS